MIKKLASTLAKTLGTLKPARDAYYAVAIIDGNARLLERIAKHGGNTKINGGRLYFDGADAIDLRFNGCVPYNNYFRHLAHPDHYVVLEPDDLEEVLIKCAQNAFDAYMSYEFERQYDVPRWFVDVTYTVDDDGSTHTASYKRDHALRAFDDLWSQCENPNTERIVIRNGDGKIVYAVGKNDPNDLKAGIENLNARQIARALKQRSGDK